MSRESLQVMRTAFIGEDILRLIKRTVRKRWQNRVFRLRLSPRRQATSGIKTGWRGQWKKG